MDYNFKIKQKCCVCDKNRMCDMYSEKLKGYVCRKCDDSKAYFDKLPFVGEKRYDCKKAMSVL